MREVVKDSVVLCFNAFVFCSRWFLEPHCLVPHFLVRFSYSSNSFSSSSRARYNSADSSTTEQTTPQAAAAAGASSTVAAAPGDPPDAARLARQSAVEAEGPQGTKSEAQTQKFDQASHCPIGAPGTCTSTTPASVQHNSSGTGDAVRCAAPFVDLIKYVSSSLFSGRIWVSTAICTTANVCSCVGEGRTQCST